MAIILYHYTDINSFNSIMSNPTGWFDRMINFFRQQSPQGINPSVRGVNSRDAYYGDGWYFTDMPPENYSRIQLAQALWDRSFQQNIHRTECFIEVAFHGNTKVIHCRPHVFLVPTESRAQQKITRYGQL